MCDQPCLRIFFAFSIYTKSLCGFPDPSNCKLMVATANLDHDAMNC